MLDRLTDNLDIRASPVTAQAWSAGIRTVPAKLRDSREWNMPDQVIGFVGIGRMGGPMAGRLLDAGYSLSAFHTQNEANEPLVPRRAHLAQSPTDVASPAALV